MKSDMDIETLKKYSYVISSGYRSRIVKALGEDYKTPTEISRDVGIRTNHISCSLAQLKQAEIVECINEDARKGRLYRLTEAGEEIARNMK